MLCLFRVQSDTTIMFTFFFPFVSLRHWAVRHYIYKYTVDLDASVLFKEKNGLSVVGFFSHVRLMWTLGSFVAFYLRDSTSRGFEEGWLEGSWAGRSRRPRNLLLIRWKEAMMDPPNHAGPPWWIEMYWRITAEAVVCLGRIEVDVNQMFLSLTFFLRWNFVCASHMFKCVIFW